VCCEATPAQSLKQQDKQLTVGLPDISQLSPQLQQEWHPDNNALLGGIKVMPGSSLKVMWSCPNCPAGCPHVWKTSVNARTRGTKCPYCQGRSVCHHSSLATKAPRQAQYWNHDKNAKTPEQTLAGSALRAEWKCPTCSHEWQAGISKRVRHDARCPKCSKIKSSGNKFTQPTFEAAKHPLLLEWDYERNINDDIHPQNTTLGSKKQVHWICIRCPKGEVHRYRMMPRDRTRRHRSGCPYCAGRQVCKCNSLATHHPVISSEWDFGMNDMTPADVTAMSNKVVWWQNSVRGSWKQGINVRTMYKRRQHLGDIAA